MKSLNLLIFVLASAAAVHRSHHGRTSQAEADRVDSLPGLSTPLNFTHYSGMLKVSPVHYLHYWFVESANSPKTDPLVLWMNGGPGCSSMDGLLNELGPFRINDDGATVRLDPYSWNLMANIIFLEAPAGVGFSYSTDQVVSTNDDQTSEENWQALVEFFKRFPQFRANDFYIGGESYAGVYVPTLVKRVLDNKKEFSMNLKGMYIGNGYLNADLNIDTSIEYAYTHGIMSEHDWDFAERTCCNGCSDFCPFHHAKGGLCANIVKSTMARIWMGGLNPYDMYRDCIMPADRHRVLAKGLAGEWLDHIDLERFLQVQSGAKGPANVPCLNDTAVQMYMNRPDVRRAIHVRDGGQWTICRYVSTRVWSAYQSICGTKSTVTEHVTSTKHERSQDVEQGYVKVYNDMEPFIRQAMAANVRVLVYNGDTDLACNFLLAQRFILELSLDFTKPKEAWFHQKQVAGYVTRYPKLDFLTVKGAGHMVPQWRPAQAFHMMYRYLHNMDY